MPRAAETLTTLVTDHPPRTYLKSLEFYFSPRASQVQRLKICSRGVSIYQALNDTGQLFILLVEVVVMVGVSMVVHKGLIMTKGLVAIKVALVVVVVGMALLRSDVVVVV